MNSLVRTGLLALAVSIGSTTFGEEPPKPAADAKAAEAPAPDTKKISYTLGAQFGKAMKDAGIAVEFSEFKRGADAAMGDGKLELTDAQMEATMQDLQNMARKHMQESKAAEATKNLEAGKKFLEENGKKEGVKTTASGLQYKVLTEGKGALPEATSTVKVHYKGTLIDGTPFDSSYDHGQPIELPITSFVTGWIEALKMMKVGSKWQLFVPGNLAYGEAGRPGIPPNATLVFEMELLDIVGAEKK